MTITSQLDLLRSACETLGLDPLAQGLQLLNAQALQPAKATPPANLADRAWSEIQGVAPYRAPLLPYPLLPTQPALIFHLGAEPAAVQEALLQRYPATHPVVLVQADGATQRLTLDALAQTATDETTTLYLAPLAALADLRGAAGAELIMARLLGPYGCPWDREQTHRSIRKDLLEEVHETLDAIDQGDIANFSEELGDLMLHILMHSEMARQAGEFSLGDMYQGLATKLLRRHPHVFGDIVANDSSTVVSNWDAIKQAERQDKGLKPRGPLDGVPSGLPALANAQALAKKAAKAGFRWNDLRGAWEKLDEELNELREAVSDTTPSPAIRKQHLEEELGDVLWMVAKIGLDLDIDAESALREAALKFRQRFAVLTQLAEEADLNLKASDSSQLLALWKEAKQRLAQ